jgi:hypothetical protein
MFNYAAFVGEADRRPSEVSVLAADVDPPGRSEPLAGQAPILRFLDDRMVLVAAPASHTDLKWCAFCVGDVIRIAARPGDRIVASRDAVDGLAVALFRGARLHVAVGSLCDIALGPDVSVDSTGRRSEGRPIEVSIRGSQRLLGSRESATIEGYEIYVERTFSVHDENESLSIASVGDIVLMNSARRSAVLMAEGDGDPLCGERTDGTMIKSRWAIG